MSVDKQLVNPFSTGGGGVHFETRVQAAFVALMVTGGFAPCLPCWPIKKIKLQGKFAGYDTDDMIVIAEDSNGQQRKLISQIKHSIRITANDQIFKEVVQAAWNDFDNKNIFNKGKDKFALITGPLSIVDTSDVRTMLERARHSESADDFLAKIEQSNFSSSGQRNKLKAFRELLSLAKGSPILNEELYQFIRHFHLLGYDLDIKAGVTMSLLHSHISQYAKQNIEGLWTQLKDLVEWANENAGTITIETLPEGIRDAFKQPIVETMPGGLSILLQSQAIPNWSQQEYASELAIANLMGSWNDKYEADNEIVGQLIKSDFLTWTKIIRDIIQLPESPLVLKNGLWSITDRKEVWQALGSRLFDDDLDNFKQCIINVLTEQDPQFELPPEERYAAMIHGKILKNSPQLRKGLAESLALIGSYPNVLNNCSSNKPETTAVLTVREILKEADWVLWGSLDSLLPLFAEAAPNEFLAAVEAALQQTPCPFDELFSQERSGLEGRNYLTGLLWALETLGWDEQYLVRVIEILGELASHDPGGNWGNRPLESLIMIFLPWLPQTMASIDKRIIAVQTLYKEFPEIAWKLLLGLLPSEHRISTGTHKPAWRRIIPEDWKKGVTKKEYSEQIISYIEMSVDLAKNNVNKLEDLVSYLSEFPPKDLEGILENLSSEEIISRPEIERLSLWNKLTEFVLRHKRFAEAKWALSPELIEKVERVASQLAPKNPLHLYQRLFSQSAYDLYDEQGDWNKQQKKLEEKRNSAVGEIYSYGGIDSIIKFTEIIESPWFAGLSSGSLADVNDSDILPALLETENLSIKEFAGGYVYGRHQSQGWRWADTMSPTNWTESQIGQFLAYLPFTDETWKRVSDLLGELEVEYWSRVNVNPYQEGCDSSVAADKLLKYNRPIDAIHCVYRLLHNKQPLNSDQAIIALLKVVPASENLSSIDTHRIVEIIKALQSNLDINQNDLSNVEWAYLSLLNKYHKAEPTVLENKLASDPDFFCEVIRIIYRSKNEPRSENEPTEKQQSVATNAYRLLSGWRIPPGMQQDGEFSENNFQKWLELTKASCIESGHIDVALTHIGSVLIYSPPDSNGLWINNAVAEALNGREEEKMRSGFRMAIFNSRGAYRVDPTGKPELELAETYKQQAEDVENAGYQRLAVTLRSLADSYINEARQISDE